MKGVDIFMKQIDINYTNNLINKNKNSILFTTNRPNIVMEHGKGMYLLDTEGKCYLDFIGGWAVNCLGHCPDIINDAIIKQAKTLFKKLDELKDKYKLKNIRGNGLLIAFDLPCDKGSEIVDKCLQEGLILNSPRPSIIRLMPPLIVTEKDTDNMINILTKVLDLTL